MLRLIWYLFLIYLVFRALRYFFRVFSGQQRPRVNQNEKEIIDVDYEELKDDGKKSN